MADAVAVSRATLRDVKQNLPGAFIYNVPVILGAAGALHPQLGVLLNPMIAGAARVMSSVTVVLNANRLRRFAARGRHDGGRAEFTCGVPRYRGRQAVK